MRWLENNQVGISIGEDISFDDIKILIELISKSINHEINLTEENFDSFPKELKRTSEFLTHSVFKDYHSESEMMRYIKSLEKKIFL